MRDGEICFRASSLCGGKSWIEHDNVFAALNSVSIGAGACLIPDYQKKYLPNHLVARSLELQPQPTIDLLVAYPKDDILPALADFLSVVRECMGSPLPASGKTVPSQPVQRMKKRKTRADD